MGLRFQRRVRLFPGVRVNFSRSGVSTSIGVRGASMTFGPQGAYANVGLPGSGLSYRTRVSPPARPSPRPAGRSPRGGRPATPGLVPQPGSETLIRSADVSVLTSQGLGELKLLINEVAAKRRELQSLLAVERRQLKKASGRLRAAEFWVVRLFTGKVIPRLAAAANAAHDAVAQTEGELDGCFVQVDFGLDGATEQSFRELVVAFEQLKTAHKIWDVTATSSVNRVAERTTASTAYRRTPVTFDFADRVIVQTSQRIMRLGNVGGRDLQIFPGFVMMRDASGDFGLVEFSEFECQLAQSNFIEEEAVPPDAEQVGTTWKRANKDGSRDRRFNDNHQIPVLRYGALVLSSPTGLSEAYQVSNYDKAAVFARAVNAHKQALAHLTTSPDQLASAPAAVDDATSDGGSPPDTPAFAPRPRNHLIVDQVALVVIVLALLGGGVWTGQHWSQIVASARGAVAAPTPAASAPPVPAASEQAQPLKHVAHHLRRHRRSTRAAHHAAAASPASRDAGAQAT